MQIAIAPLQEIPAYTYMCTLWAYLALYNTRWDEYVAYQL